MTPVVYLLVHVLLGTATSALMTKSYSVPLMLLFVYWTLSFLANGLDATPLELLHYWTIGPIMGLVGVAVGTLASTLLGVPRLLDALLLPNDGNKQTRAPIRRVAWEVALMHFFTFLVFLAVKFILGEFSDDSTSIVTTTTSLAVGITVAIVAGVGLIASATVACMVQTHRFEKRQNVKYFVQHFLQAGLLPVLALYAFSCQASAWWISLAYLGVALGALLLAYVHTAMFTYFSGAYSRDSGVAPPEGLQYKPFFDSVLRYRAPNDETMDLLGAGDEGLDDDGEVILYDNMVSSGRALRFFLPLLVLTVLVILADWISLYWLCVTNPVTHAVVLGVVAIVFGVGVVVSWLLLRRRDREASADAAYPAYVASRIGSGITRGATRLNGYLASLSAGAVSRPAAVRRA